jgi:hypothetical protein
MRDRADDAEPRRPSRRSRTASKPEGFVDEAPDVFQVKHLGPGSFQVLHYPDASTTKACCNVKVEISDEDRRRGQDDGDPSGATAALARADRTIYRKHEGK